MAYHLEMTRVQSLLSLHAGRWSQRRMAAALRIDRATVAGHLRQVSKIIATARGRDFKCSHCADRPGPGVRSGKYSHRPEQSCRGRRLAKCSQCPSSRLMVMSLTTPRHPLM